MARIAIQPARNRAGRPIQDHAETTEGPAVIRDRDEETGGQTIQRANLATDQRDFAAESHRSDVEGIHRRHDRRLELAQPAVGIHIVERAEQLLLRVEVSRGAIAADAYADGTRAAALALSVPDRVQNALAHAFERAVGAPEMRQFDRQRVLRVRVFAAAGIENQFDLSLLSFPL